ncbi:BQ5605_C002g01683 [Microbotryum silenes-dioicae]|uniref:BQ5605_C002g01683 protein n=1 Tax=Microbotryum silenes-dioicae TaxID=796604 RepID=A0A2X0LZK0_9BASI|nr:BQ5605_C002g01683 [Microbotryum silenes-dioicae]
MFPDLLVIRIALRILFLVLDSIAPFSLAWTVASIWLWPVHPLVALWPIDHLDLLLRHDFYLHNIVTGWCFIESIWWFFHTIGRHLVARGYWDFREAKQPLVAEERWRLWVKMLESFPDPWEWLGGTFLAPGLRSAPLGMEDPAITRVRIQDVGRSNIEHG